MKLLGTVGVKNKKYLKLYKFYFIVLWGLPHTHTHQSFSYFFNQSNYIHNQPSIMFIWNLLTLS